MASADSNTAESSSHAEGGPAGQTPEQGVSASRELNLGAISSQKVEPLRDDNWLAWKIRITNLLHLYDVYDYVTGKRSKPSSPAEFEAWKKQDTVARTLIYNNVDSEQVVHVTECETSAELWSAFKLSAVRFGAGSGLFLLNPHLHPEVRCGSP